ncbi:MAG: glycosyltransferase [Muribaculaceae bacterium]|nr:glycosyltransferase [Muribaculaceae bacterium]
MMSAMNAILLDLSGKVGLYDQALYKALKAEAADASIRYLAPGKGLLSLVPQKFAPSEHITKRLVKVAEGLLNYAITCIIVAFARPEVLHLQWLPFMEVVSWEIPILKLIKRISPKTRLVLTIHNVYPHNMSQEAKRAYNARFRKVCALFDAFIVHTRISKEDVAREFGIEQDKLHICCHGVFEPQGITITDTSRRNGKLHILQFGGQSPYKGTDLLVDAVCGLDTKHKAKVETHIVGGISQSFLDTLKAKDCESSIIWKPYFLDDEELYREINDADLIVLPYRAISQSGVLLLSIYFGKLIICSNLPSFVETMRGNEGGCLDDSIFFKSEDSESLRNLIIRYIDGEINESAVRQRISHLKKLYSWESAAKATLNVYNEITTAICN